MALENSQYDAIMRHYEEIRTRHREEREERVAQIYHELPQLKELDDTVAAESVRAVRARIQGNDHALEDYQKTMERLSQQRSELLASHHYTPEDFEEHYDCPLCHDTGYVDGRYCTCFQKAATDLLYAQYAAGTALKDENFPHFSFSWYSDTIMDDSKRKSERDYARDAYKAAQAFVPNIGKPDNNLLLYGNTGVGKTFLTHCIAKEALDDGHSVLYFSAAEFFDLLAEATFQRTSDAVTSARMIERCDLLIIDDLGTEFANNFTASQLFQVLNERILHSRSTIISTNLSLSELSAKYTERVFSRIASSYTIKKLIGRDIRIRRKTERG